MSDNNHGGRVPRNLAGFDPDSEAPQPVASTNGDPRLDDDIHVAALHATHHEEDLQDEHATSMGATFRSWKELRTTKYGLYPAMLLSGIGLFQGLASATFAVSLPEIIQDIDLDIFGLIGLVQITGVLVLFMTIGVGWYGDRHRRIPLVAGGALVSGITTMANATSATPFQFGAWMVPGSVFNAAGDVPNLSLFGDYYAPKYRGKIISLFLVMGRFAAILAPLIVAMVAYWFGWRVGFLVFGAPVIVLAILAFFLPEPIRGYWERRELGAQEDVALVEEDPQSFGEAWRTIWAVRTLRRLFISTIPAAATGRILGIFMPIFLADVYSLNVLQRGLMGIPAALVGVVGVYYGGNLIDVLTRRNPGRVLTWIGALSLVGVAGQAIWLLTPPLWVALTLGAVFAFAGSLVEPASGVVMVQVIPPTVRTMGVQLLGLAAIPALIFGLPLAGAAQASFDMGITAIFVVTIPFSIIAAIVTMSASGFFELDMRNAMAAAMAKEEHRRAVQAGTAKLLVCRDVDVAYDGVQVLFGVDFDVEKGEIIALLGTNGAGKSTLLRAISGSQEASGGGIVMDGRDITHMPPHEIARRGVIHMPGGRGIFPGLSVAENIALGAWMIEDEQEKKAAIDETYQTFPALHERRTTDAGALSGGEQQQLSLAQAFLGRPKLLMIDELSLGLSPAIVAELLDKVRAIHARGATIIIVEQSVNVALTIAERAIFMEKGQVKFVGDTKELLRRPDILRAVYVKGTGALTTGTTAARRSSADQRMLDFERSTKILEVEGLVKNYGGVRALGGVTFDVAEGMVLGVVGPNGSGKTTMFDVISGFQPANEGVVRYRGVDITKASPEERANQGLIRRFQDARLFPSLTVYETLLVALDQRHEARNTIVNALSLPNARKAERRQRTRADSLIELLELGSYQDKFVKDLSTGLRRIVDIACTLAAQPKLLLLDEPSSGIAQSEAEGLAPLLRRIQHETGATIMIIEHDMPLLSRVSDEMIVLDRGALLMRGTPAEVLNDDRVIEAYLGTSEAAVQRSGGLA